MRGIGRLIESSKVLSIGVAAYASPVVGVLGGVIKQVHHYLLNSIQPVKTLSLDSAQRRFLIGIDVLRQRDGSFWLQCL